MSCVLTVQQEVAAWRASLESKEAHVEACAGHTLRVRWVGMATHFLGPHQTLEGISKVPFGLERVNLSGAASGSFWVRNLNIWYSLPLVL